ncbi:transglutaminase family protein [Sandaracinus amylolyticus]|uniref:Large protein containing transglutaminase-like domain protein n=1 Tax=Sandaracinus amylolyticus TaxID=927083 RepID=A0A0F6W7F3_9BACT|nr:transglutaminase family protein [Sandaracinus amylolyticus]AKF09348.1 Large protein containing transglutaminase-like domain protein [Sandaracinus amylolyticus]
MIDDALDTLDRAIGARFGHAIWIGSEPTFTDASSFDAEWNGAALGPTKEARARALVARIAARRPWCVVLRSVGRQYGAEEVPRWSYGLWGRRDRDVVWRGPLDPLLGAAVMTEHDARDACERARDAIAEALAAQGASVGCFETDHDLRIVARADGGPLEPSDERLLAPSPHDVKTPDRGLDDALAREGTWLFRLRVERAEGGSTVRLELPGIGRVDELERVFDLLARALAPVALPSLIFAGHPPPVDARIAHATVTPDPAVIEVNAAPHATARAFADDAREWHDAARDVGLAPRRLFYDGEASDSGGGGQITIGGPSADESPFFVAPALLPRLVTLCAAHPSLSYLFAVDNVGPWSQSPRADEGVRASFGELVFAIERIARGAHALDRDTLQGTLGPFLRDVTGNAHRAEINVEKLWNADLPQRGRLGLVELRAFRMARSPERAAALGAMVRAIVAYLATTEIPLELPDWGDALHDRWLLPTFLARDLDEVLATLRGAGLGLGRALEDELRATPERVIGVAEDGQSRLTITRALEIWPLIGDAGSQEQHAARWIDASTRRIEIRVDGAPGSRIMVNGHAIALRALDDHTALRGVRHRAFIPARGLHPGVAAQVPLRITWQREGAARALEATLHDWRPGGGAYDGLPQDDDEARRRREERFVVREIDAPEIQHADDAARWTIDLRAHCA